MFRLNIDNTLRIMQTGAFNQGCRGQCRMTITAQEGVKESETSDTASKQSVFSTVGSVFDAARNFCVNLCAIALAVIALFIVIKLFFTRIVVVEKIHID